MVATTAVRGGGRGRFAPSPSGRMHLGNLFSALFAWLDARSSGSVFSLRLEDLDERCANPENAELIREDLRWLGLDWDEELCQSAQLGVYEQAFEVLSGCAELYPCFCSRADLHVASAPHASDGTPLYAQTCRFLSEEDRHVRAKTRPPAWRLHLPDRTISFDDGHMGHFEQNLQAECGDFVLKRSDGVFAYQLVCVVDDARNAVTRVVRGSDLLSSTPRQMLLFELLGFDAPSYYHHPMLLAPDGRRLSKRERDLDTGVLRENGVQPERLIGKLAHLAGLLDEQEAAEGVSAHELIDTFAWQKVPTPDIKIDPETFAASC